MSHDSLLHNVYLFKTFTEDELALVHSIVEYKKYDENVKIFSQSEVATALYIIKFGSVRISQTSDSGDKVNIATLGLGSHFGEMAFLDNEPRSATATSLESSEIIIISYKKLLNLVESNLEVVAKIYAQFAYFLASRLRVTTHDLSFAREKNLSHF